MRYFDYLSNGELDRLFFCRPGEFSRASGRALLRKAVGGLLYIPASSREIARIIISGKVEGLSSMAVCLEDSVGDGERTACVENVKKQFDLLARALADGSLCRLPLLFVRVKDNDMLKQMADFFVQYRHVLTGVILPKVTRDSLEEALSIVSGIGSREDGPFYAMPILESAELMLAGSQDALLRDLCGITDKFYDYVLNIRVGATDLCGLYGIRRGMDTPIYSIPLVGGMISSVVRVFGMCDRYTVSGPVWEYYRALASARELGQSPEAEGLLREVALDVQNGILGKTCVHPTQLLPVQASYTIPYEDYQDACGILGGGQDLGGVQASVQRNKMNELKPHALWAEKTLQQARIYGVRREGVGLADFLRAVYDRERQP